MIRIINIVFHEDVGSIPDTVYWMDVSVASYYIERKLIKVAKWGTPKIKKKYLFHVQTRTFLYLKNLKKPDNN